RARRDAAQAADRRVVGAGGRVRPLVARGDAGDVRPVERLLPVERELASRARAGAGKGAGDDHLRRREGGVALREAGRVRVAGRAVSTRARYAREEALAASSLRPAKAAGLRPNEAASGGSFSVTITRTRPEAWPRGTWTTPARRRGSP